MEFCVEHIYAQSISLFKFPSNYPLIIGRSTKENLLEGYFGKFFRFLIEDFSVSWYYTLVNIHP